jgi:hypothetical protein
MALRQKGRARDDKNMMGELRVKKPNMKALTKRRDEPMTTQPPPCGPRLYIRAAVVALWDINEIGPAALKGVKVRHKGRQVEDGLRRNNGGAHQVLERGIAVEPAADGTG